MERTLVMINHDGLQRGLAGEVISRLESRGLKIVAMKMLQMDEAKATRHYEPHVGKPFFEGLMKFITSSPLRAMVLQGENAVETTRNTMGTTNPLDASPGTIRGDLATDIGRNLVHGSDSPDTAKKEIEIFFSPEEVLDYPRSVEPWVTES
ncbi:MAG: nucleoside-diphosphate kinase [Dehalococcoidia bacterium]|nr:nucleoside-diphosphate kinase [Dehalococcoidia bacterium]